MSRMQKEIMECLSGLETAPNELSARFSFPPEFAGFQGHFEDNPVLPGICKILAVLAMLGKYQDRPFRLREVGQAKYFMPVTVGQEITIKCDSQPNDDGSIAVKAVIRKEAAKVALLQMVIENA